MDQSQFNYDDICRHIGRLYLTLSKDGDRMETILTGRIRVLEDQLRVAQEQVEFLRKTPHDRS